MGAGGVHEFNNDEMLEYYYQQFSEYVDQIEAYLKVEQYIPYAIHGALRAATLIANHPGNIDGNPKIPSTAELFRYYKDSCDNTPDLFMESEQPNLLKSQQVIWEAYAKILASRHQNDISGISYKF